METKYTLRYMRFFAPYSSKEDSIDSAAKSAYWMVEDNTAYPVELVDEAGVVVATHDELIERGTELCNPREYRACYTQRQNDGNDGTDPVGIVEGPV